MAAAWVDRLERKLGFLEVPNLAAFMCGMNALCGVLTLFKPEFPSQLLLNPLLLRQGQVWRALTFILVPPVPPEMPIWLFVWLLMYFYYLNLLERAWGSFKFTLFVLIGALSTAAAAGITGFPLGSGAFVTSLFLAFARLNPDLEILLFFFFPVKMRWLSALAWALIGWSLVFGGYEERLAIVSGMLNYALYFGPDHLRELKQAWRRSRMRP
jgi:hypothetical protein